MVLTLYFSFFGLFFRLLNVDLQACVIQSAFDNDIFMFNFDYFELAVIICSNNEVSS